MLLDDLLIVTFSFVCMLDMFVFGDKTTLECENVIRMCVHDSMNAKQKYYGTK